MEAGSREILPNQEWGLKASRRAPKEAKKENRNEKEGKQQEQSCQKNFEAGLAL